MNPEKRDFYEIDKKNRELQQARKFMYHELNELRKRVDRQEEELERKNMQLSRLERQLVLGNAGQRAAQAPMNPMMASQFYMMPMQMSGGNVQFTNFANMQMQGMPGGGIPMQRQPTAGTGQRRTSRGDEPPVFFSKKVIKPIRGGGKAAGGAGGAGVGMGMPQRDPYERRNTSGAAAGMPLVGASKEEMMRKGSLLISASAAPVIHPENQKQQSKTPGAQSAKRKMEKMRKAEYMNKYLEAQKMSEEQAIAEETFTQEYESESGSEEGGDERLGSEKKHKTGLLSKIKGFF